MMEWRFQLIHEIKIDRSQQAGFINSFSRKTFENFDFSSFLLTFRLDLVDFGTEISVEKINITSVSV